ncbi:MAG: 4Fe-4S binding protein [Deltaproteobacteria bacterium]|nr:4Fe-4S binding protein [Deltaproteobacteria bacterium]
MKARYLLWLRRTSQCFFLVLFVYLLVESRLPQDVYLNYSVAVSPGEDLRLNRPVTLFFKMDPLVGVTSLLSGSRLIKGFIWGAGVLVLTVLLGRVFCGFVCPLGTINHLAGWPGRAARGSFVVTAGQKRPGHRVKYFILVLLLISAVLGLNLAGIADPISLLFRSLALAIIPGVGIGLRSLFDLMAESGVKLLNLLSYGAEVILAPVFGYEARAYQTAWFIGLAFSARGLVGYLFQVQYPQAHKARREVYTVHEVRSKMPGSGEPPAGY